jgi:hypothetical protein
MSLTVFLDAGPLGLVTNPKKTRTPLPPLNGFMTWRRLGIASSSPRLPTTRYGVNLFALARNSVLRD